MTPPEVYPSDQTIGLDVGYMIHSHNPYPTPAPFYSSRHLQAPPHLSAPIYVNPQPLPSREPEVVDQSMRVSSYYSYNGATQIQR